MYKTVFKNILVNKQTDPQLQNCVSSDEKVLIDFVVETEPSLFGDVASFWLYSSFMSGESYEAVLAFLLDYFEKNTSLALFDQGSFTKWLKII